MSKRSREPALYEMMRNRGQMPAVPSAPAPRHTPVREVEEFEVMRDDASPSPLLERLMSLMSPGRTVRVPVGYLLVACAPVIILLVTAYAIGVSTGKSRARAEFEEKFGVMPSNAPAVNDPLSLETLDAAGKTGGGNPAALQGGASTDSQATPPVAARPPANWGPVVPNTDPRQKGLNYFILAETTAQGAHRLADFCRSNGLETYVVPGKNERRLVIAFPGYQGSRLAPEVRALENRIHTVGDKYKSQYKNETNMRDAYPVLHGG